MFQTEGGRSAGALLCSALRHVNLQNYEKSDYEPEHQHNVSPSKSLPLTILKWVSTVQAYHLENNGCHYIHLANAIQLATPAETPL